MGMSQKEFETKICDMLLLAFPDLIIKGRVILLFRNDMQFAIDMSARVFKIREAYGLNVNEEAVAYSEALRLTKVISSQIIGMAEQNKII